METAHLPHLPLHPLRICLFTDVHNAPFLRQQLLHGNTDFEYAFLDAAVLLSRAHVLAACFRAINDMQGDRLKSRNVHSEIVFAMHPNNNVGHFLSASSVLPASHHAALHISYHQLIISQIAESFRRFGIQDDTKTILAIKVGGDEAAVRQHLLSHVEGTAVPLTDEALAHLHDAARIRKIYRLDAPKKGEAAAQLGKEAEAFIVGSMALKGS